MEELTANQVKSHLQSYRITKQKEAIQDERRKNMIRRENMWECIQNQQRLMQHGKIIEFGESSNKTKEVSYKSLSQSSSTGLNETRNGEGSSDGNNDETLSLELTLGIKY
ncbi:unnamed protein product [Arabis nemorensis]|uniref:HTH myb-type domain-containing protein n=1 Tax=Arabis nemorensis TaxID=586526 RepID=A0A565C5A8_9BRAS|nr:unnamed protein product [Arabis nemorensis]